ncbi:MAG: transglutaminase-like cysteine peptidase, partial [Terricaulis silvestris]
MRMGSAVAVAMLVSALVGGCASIGGVVDARRAPFPSGDAARLVVDTDVAPAPAGLIVFCELSFPCGSEERLRGFTDSTGAVSNGAVTRADRSRVFRALLLQQSQASRPTIPATLVELTPELWRVLVQVNDQINWAIIPATDQTTYGVEERWAMPLSHPNGDQGAPRGDCEDYVLEKRSRLIAQGFDQRSLSIAVALAPSEGRHAVLVVHTSRGDFVLDNLRETPMPIEQLPYVWVSAQR